MRWIALGDLEIPRIWTFIPENHFLKKREKWYSSAFVYQLETSSKGHCISGLFAVQLLSRVRLCDPMDCSPSDLPVHHQLVELAQIHVHWISDAIQPSQPLSPCSPALSLSQLKLTKKQTSPLQLESPLPSCTGRQWTLGRNLAWLPRPCPLIGTPGGKSVNLCLSFFLPQRGKTASEPLTTFRNAPESSSINLGSSPNLKSAT